VLNLLNIDEELPERLPEIEELTAMLLFVVEGFKRTQKEEIEILKKADDVGAKMIEAAFELYEKSINKRGLG